MRSLSPLLLVTTLLLPACAAGPALFTSRPEQPLRWPDGEQPARITMEFAYGSLADTQRSPGFWQGVGNLVLGEEARALAAPYGLATSADGETLYVADPGLGVVHRLSLLTGEHEYLKDTGEQPLQSPIGVLVLDDGTLLVSDSALGRLFHFDAAGKGLGLFAEGTDLGRPTGLAWDQQGQRILVLDTVGGSLFAFDRSGKLLQHVGGEGDAVGLYNHPTNLAVSPDGRVFLTDSLNFRIQILNSDLTPLDNFGIAGTGPGAFAKPKGIGLDSDGHIYVVDGMFDNVQIFDQQGRLLLAFGRPGSALGRFSLPTGLYIDSRDRIFVSDSGNSRVQVFHYHPLEVTP